MTCHKMRERQLAVDLAMKDGDTSPKQSQKLDHIDAWMTEMQKCTETCYKKIMRPGLDFSDEGSSSRTRR